MRALDDDVDGGGGEGVVVVVVDGELPWCNERLMKFIVNAICSLISRGRKSKMTE